MGNVLEELFFKVWFYHQWLLKYPLKFAPAASANTNLSGYFNTWCILQRQHCYYASELSREGDLGVQRGYITKDDTSTKDEHIEKKCISIKEVGRSEHMCVSWACIQRKHVNKEVSCWQWQQWQWQVSTILLLYKWEYSKYLTSTSRVPMFGSSISCRAKVPGDVRLVKTMEFLGLLHHWMKRSRENPHSRSGTLASTTYNRRREQFTWESTFKVGDAG